MKVLRLALICAFAFLAISQSCVDADKALDDQGQGEKLVQQLWTDMKEGNIEAIEGYIAEGFQSIHEDGARNRDEEVQLIKGLNLGDYSLSKCKVTRDGPVLIVSYFVSVEETIDGERLTSAPAARLSAWLQTEDTWQWIIHANLKPLKTEN